MKLLNKIRAIFTVVKMMTMVSILAILVTIASAAYRNYLTQSKVGIILSYLSPVKNIILGYTNEHNDQLPNTGIAEI